MPFLVNVFIKLSVVVVSLFSIVVNDRILVISVSARIHSSNRYISNIVITNTQYIM